MGITCAPPYTCLVVRYKEETKLFLIELQHFFSTEEIMARLWPNLLWPAMLNFNSFMICLNDLHPSTNYIYEKAKVTRDEKENLV